jgi:hypothetical protein
MVQIARACAVLLALSACAGSSHAQNLVQNPGFEDSTSPTTSPGWTVTAGNDTTFDNGGSEAQGIHPDEPPTEGNGNAHTGVWDVQFGATSASEATAGTLSQTIATVPGTTYLVTFFLMNTDGPHNTFLATFGGQTVLSLTDANAFGYTQYSANITATSGSSVLAFSAEQDPGFYYLDDVSVEAGPAPVMGGGLVSFGVLLAGFDTRRARRKVMA